MAKSTTESLDPKKNMPPKQQRASTLGHLELDRIRDGVVILKNGGYRSILRTTNVNFSLKSEMEQNAMIFSYRNFLNSFDEFPVQIVIRTRPLDIDPYLDKLRKWEETHTSELLKLQTSEYIDYIKRLIEVANILDRQFFVVVPYADAGQAVKSSIGIGSLGKSKKQVDQANFDKAKTVLQQRADGLIGHLSSVGVKARALETSELIELFYDIYNPETAQLEKFEVDPADLTTPVTTFKTRAELRQIEQMKREAQT